MWKKLLLLLLSEMLLYFLLGFRIWSHLQNARFQLTLYKAKRLPKRTGIINYYCFPELGDPYGPWIWMYESCHLRLRDPPKWYEFLLGFINKIIGHSSVISPRRRWRNGRIDCLLSLRMELVLSFGLYGIMLNRKKKM